MAKRQWPILRVLKRAKKADQQRCLTTVSLATVRQEMMEDSQLTWPYLTLVVSSCLIASFGLLANSAAVIIGAMLVAPLMLPIRGAAFGILEANRKLIRHSLVSLLVGSGLALAIATALPAGGRLIGFDIAEDSTALARQAWQRAGVAERVELRLEDGALGLPRLQGEDLAGKVDLAYVDGANNQYQKNLEDVLPLLRPGGLLVFDNTLWKGEVADSSSTDSQAAHLRELNRQLRQDPNLLSCVLSLGDGVSLAIKRSAT